MYASVADALAKLSRVCVWPGMEHDACRGVGGCMLGVPHKLFSRDHTPGEASLVMYLVFGDCYAEAEPCSGLRVISCRKSGGSM